MFSLWPWPKVIQLRAFYFCWQIIIPHHLLDGIKKMRLLCFTTFIRKYVHSWKDTKIQFWLVNDTWMGGICSDWEIPHTFWFGLRKYSKITPNNKGGRQSRDSGNDFFVPKILGGSGTFPFLLLSFLFLFPNVSRNENILFLKKSFLFGYPKYFRITEKRKETTVIFRVPEKKRLFYRRGYFKKRKQERKVVSTISGGRGTHFVILVIEV